MQPKKIYFSIIVLVALFFVSTAYASETIGTINSSYYTAQICEDSTCSTTSTSPVNFGYFTTQSAYNVSITDTGLTGYIWGTKFGWVVLNCNNTTSGCSSLNGNFKVVPSSTGVLSGYAWGDVAGWINFGPFLNSATSQVTISSNGEFNGYAWSQNYGWIKFDCSLSDYCVKTDWVPPASRSSGSSPSPSPTTNSTTRTGSIPNYKLLLQPSISNSIGSVQQPTTPPSAVNPTHSPYTTNSSKNVTQSTVSGSAQMVGINTNNQETQSKIVTFIQHKFGIKSPATVYNLAFFVIILLLIALFRISRFYL